MVDSDILEGAVAGLVAAALYSFYRKLNRTAFALQKMEVVEIGADLQTRLEKADRPYIAYAAVQGTVSAQGKTLKSENSPTEGVIVHRVCVEHLSQWINGVWSPATKVLKEKFDFAPFALENNNNPGHSVLVMDAVKAEHLSDCLEQTHYEFTVDQSLSLTGIVRRLFGKMTHGYERSENMLPVGTSMLGIGELILDNGKLKLIPPRIEGLKYYLLTSMSKGQALKIFQLRAKSTKIMSILLGLWSLYMFGRWAVRMVRGFHEWEEMQRQMEEMRQIRIDRLLHPEAGDWRESPQEEPCVICLDNPREVVTLNCRHLAMCSDCCQIMQDNRCPVCRDPIQSFLPIYRP